MQRKSVAIVILMAIFQLNDIGNCKSLWYGNGHDFGSASGRLLLTGPTQRQSVAMVILMAIFLPNDIGNGKSVWYGIGNDFASAPGDC